MRHRTTPALLLLTAVLACLAVAIGAAMLAFGAFPQGEQPSPAASAVPSTSAAAGVATPPSATPRPSVRLDPPLPALLGSIGDSISVAFDVTATGFGPNRGSSWVTGDTAGDGVFSILERLRALGGDPAVADAAVAGARMADAATQAKTVIRAAAKLPKGTTALVTIELGGNDACDGTPPTTFEQDLRAAVAVLRGGLPAGSRLLVLSVPNIVRLHDLTAPVQHAQEIYAQFHLCQSFLAPSLTPAQLTEGERRIEALNAVLARVCGGIEATDGKSGRLYCRSDQQGAATGSMFGSDFELTDISPLDYFHPSLDGQARIAAGAWAAGYWSTYPLPASDTSVGQP